MGPAAGHRRERDREWIPLASCWPATFLCIVDNSDGSFGADDLARLDEAIAGLDVLLAPYNVTITEISDRSLANLVLDFGVTSAAGGLRRRCARLFHEHGRNHLSSRAGTGTQAGSGGHWRGAVRLPDRS